MAKTNTKVSDRSNAKSRKDIIKFYVDRKKSNRNYLPKRDLFLKEMKISRSQLEMEFGSFSEFLREAEAEYLRSLGSIERALLSEQGKKFCSNATKEECIEDLRAIQNSEPLKHITRNFYRTHGKYSDSTWDQFFGTFAEFRKQAGLELTRPQQKLEKQIARHASVDHYREYYEINVAPYYLKFEKDHLPTKIKRIMIISDIHDLDCDEFTLDVFILECQRKQPDIIVLNGDIFDLYEFSRYGQDPRKVKIKERFDFIRKRVFKALRDACPDAQIDFIMGNHEFRLIKHLADQTPHLRVLLSDVMGISFSTIFGLDEFKINWTSKFDLSAFTKKDIKDELKKNHKIYFDTYAVSHEPDARLQASYSGTNGHHHSASYESGFNLHRGCISWVQTPAGHVKDAEYLNRVPGWNTGFLEVTINVDERQAIQRIHQTQENWTEIDGVYYERREKI